MQLLPQSATIRLQKQKNKTSKIIICNISNSLKLFHDDNN